MDDTSFELYFCLALMALWLVCGLTGWGVAPDDYVNTYCYRAC